MGQSVYDPHNKHVLISAIVAQLAESSYILQRMQVRFPPAIKESPRKLNPEVVGVVSDGPGLWVA